MRGILSLYLLGAACLWADGHGPAFGYSTTTLGEGDTSVETALMWRSGVAMLAPLVSYGATENLQFSVSAPFHLNHGDHPVGRFTADMPGNPEAEVLAAWRFHHKLTGMGARNESTLYLGASESTQLPPRADGPPLSRATGLYIAGATGHISRRYYIWGGAGYQRYNSTGNDHQSNSFLSSLVVGWRPKFWEKDSPNPTCVSSGRPPASISGVLGGATSHLKPPQGITIPHRLCLPRTQAGSSFCRIPAAARFIQALRFFARTEISRSKAEYFLPFGANPTAYNRPKPSGQSLASVIFSSEATSDSSHKESA